MSNKDKEQEVPVLTFHSLARGFVGGLAMGLVVGAAVALGHKIGNVINGR